LIITLILLGVVTFMAIAFLALSRRERGAVATVTDTASARLAADAALANAEAQVMANVLSTTNPCNFGLLVSTNYINTYGFQTGIANPTNVNYAYANGSPLNNLPPNYDFLQNLANLYISPRAPVFIPNPTNSSMPSDFRYYLDLNRNGRYDATGVLTNYNNAGNALLDASGNVITNFQVGDPEWIGILQRPDQPYGPNNPFVARYAFIALPIGNTLDLNAIYNYAKRLDANMQPLNDSFYRNQGVGSWEINLAAFLADLNANEWLYNYAVVAGTGLPDFGAANSGTAFDDALSVLRYRYDTDYINKLASVDTLFGPASPGHFAFLNDNIDGYSDGPLQTGFQLPGDIASPVNDDPAKPWAGANNTNHFFSMQELFDPMKTFSFSANLLTAGMTNWGGTAVSTYDRYTFYRLLSQLGTDSTPDSDRMNLNYDNLNPYALNENGKMVFNTNGVASATNFVSWQPLAFFTNAADRLLRAYTTGWRNSNPTNFATTFYTVTSTNITNPDQWINYPAFGIGRIPVLVSNRFVYSSAVNRLLQLAANMYDATTNRTYSGAPTYPYLPTVFQPIFMVTNGNVYITNFVEVTVSSSSFFGNPQIKLLNLGFGSNVVATLALQPNDLVFGVPLIIGAKKGLPNFNEFALDSAFRLTRKLQVTRPTTNVTYSTRFGYNQMFNLSVSNQLGVECWNSYSTNYPRQVDIYVTNYVFLMLTNDATDEKNFVTNQAWTFSGSVQIPSWPAWSGQVSDASFQIPLSNSVSFVPDSTYVFNIGGNPYLTNPPASDFETNVTVDNGTTYFIPQPHWTMTMTNLLQVIMVDDASGRIIDYVQLSGPNSSRDLSAEIQQNYTDVNNPNPYKDQWDTNLFNQGLPIGLNNQITVSQGNGDPTYDPAYWGQNEQSAFDQMNAFLAFTVPNFNSSSYLTYPGYIPNANVIGAAYTTNALQAPYTPSAPVYQHVTWQANDPLVHYLANDLTGAPKNGLYTTVTWPDNLGKLNDRYMPWGGRPGSDFSSGDTSWQALTCYNTAVKDPLVWSSDDWDFPANKFPTIGWLGRVHRGTPWQTVYLKASDILAETTTADSNFGINAWTNWTGNANLTNATYNTPVQDRLLFDLFTTAFNDNATRGTLSVNVGTTNANLAAWSALFSGVIVLSNNAADASIQPSAGNQHPATLAMTAFPINPAGNAGLGSALGQLVAGINQTRINTKLFPSQSFAHAGDILSVPQLTEQSPFLNWNSAVQKQNGISDELMEWLPQQVMSLLRCSTSPRYVIYSYGQTLKPAPDSIVTSGGQYFGMITNYQIVSEIATRAVVRFNSTVTNVITMSFTNDALGNLITNWYSVPVVTNNNAVIESFNILPPD
jgi:hypothetical protein